ncbi:carbonic anhydrase [Clostridium magnum]|uniref:carbonic anhydrase n=1 Tax=Clostridium magnum DSM 2767 TaxID=1121326 RepID=A0A161XBG2_9CLOT|nr:carbonic anhydrase [Clostridium magnum]KZL91616.1 carbonic anhydrase [Clostridium magnum DSM 2767]SHH49608.1 carbonic anhydrase [Clostridium magnum DSM 2767]
MKKGSKLKLILTTLVLSTSIVFGSGCTDASKTSKETEKSTQAEDTRYTRPETITSAEEAKKLLVDGNNRFVSGKILSKDLSDTRRKDLSVKGQKPFAVVITCSDSRVPPELIFDQALGDIFVIRDAGNVVDPITLGSIEYGAEHLGGPLIVVLGHEKCGAVKATVDGGEVPENIAAIVNKIKPSVEKAKSSAKNKEDIPELATDENINNTIAEIKKSSVIKHLEESKKVTVVGAKYHLESGQVTFTQ